MFSNPFKKKNSRVHLDYASSTPVAPEVFDVMLPYFSSVWANPSAVYKEGVDARRVINDAREKIARTLHVRSDGIVFTSGGTEANNLALVGIVEKIHEGGVPYTDMEIISSHIEHPSILETLLYLKKRGVVVRYVPVRDYGRIDMNAFEALLSMKTVLVTFAYVNSEVGVIEDIKKISRTVGKWNISHHTRILIHTDACQAPLWLSCALDALGVDLLTLDSGKCYGPKGVGVLAWKHGVELDPITFGGGQERGLRSGTENVPLIVGCAKALTRAQVGFESRSLSIAKLRDHLFMLIQKSIPEAIVNGSREYRVANNVNISLLHSDTEYATIYLDAKGIAVSTKSACGAKDGHGSTVVREMTHDDMRALSTLRMTLGEENMMDDLIRVVDALHEYRTTLVPHQRLTS